MSKEDREPITTTLRKTVKTALKYESVRRNQHMGEIIEEALAKIGIPEQEDESGENNSSIKQ
ncbi:hypothetical protein [Roseobacter weihaiensis]|uniref:hypothetical protein n=1 Tax=Roseobacter weihaiensis TaxID=2763262 RepID=UPI001D0A17F7|nr:hypothetical protein [Roseobacter sp. H9]